MGIPQYAADESEQQHGRGSDRDSGAEEHKMDNQDTRVAQAGERGHELLSQEGGEQKENSAEVEA